ncbi:ASCH domain-containing protein [Roseateles chitosanitabidus]|uniref:ASCH domain-containing protein n=1 Tax=Roseateles chitosanitabidus TaxID=65048 RepID=UPI000A5179BD|nr:ASCH domain-containing protein [Roseateles chitosanitabidus]
MVKAICIRQPWAWLILHGGKDIENRSWATKVRGRVLIHASQGMTFDEWNDGVAFARLARDGLGHPPVTIPGAKNIERGGIVGSVEIVDCVTASTSPWYMGDVGFVLRDPRPLPFVPMKGRLGFFDVPHEVLAQLGTAR